MTPWLNYWLEANLCLCVLLLLYRVLLWRQTAFAWQRVVLLGATLIAVVVPLFHLHTGAGNLSVEALLPTTWLEPVTVIPQGAAHVRKPLSGLHYVAMVYGLGATFFLFRLLVRVYQVRRFTQRYPVAEQVDGIPVYRLPAAYATFSFFRAIFLGREAQAPEARPWVLRHELVHVQRYHSYDILWIHILQVLFWVNPVLVLYKTILTELHEFEADARAAIDGDAREYCSLLAKTALASADVPLAHSFSTSFILKRIHMIKTNKKGISTPRMVMLTVCATAFCYFIVSSEQVVAQQQTPAKGDVSSSNEVLEKVDQLPEFDPDGLQGLFGFLQENLQYPAEAARNKVEGKVFVSFIVEKDGSVSGAAIKKGVADDLDKEALRVVKLTRWQPAKVDGKIVRSRLTLPVQYKLGS